MRISTEVADALTERAPVVALESTVITHGLPRPHNLELAKRLEEVVREGGAVPATVAVVAGEVRVGLEPPDLERLASGGADKASLWNFAALLAAGRDAGTTVATTLFAAFGAGIKVFATGGIGGVHDTPFDESADLVALANYRVLTVCAGPKSILDAEATTERLETLGVPVVGYRSDRLAGFFVEETAIPLPSRVDDPAAAAAVLRAQERLGLGAGVLISNPVSSGLPRDRFDTWLQAARASAVAAGVHGRDTTPYMLDAVAKLSNGETMTVNLRLLEENARLAARIAAAYAGASSAAPDLVGAGVR
ncbi:MAG: pseudouridine-5'-phosphate glycosidase [Trueperaceae bacterium]|nr:pseudouridine-5'-phosphate glycosidase [Trueperaceae bacterium]MCC6312045.1 pseudouridine-5'-phosphate glycosidase [Trueperaceae bacterium]MCW5820103.1 pseudouridine-5'-phosphate glycosidase [Trueperaceae bacterium]